MACRRELVEYDQQQREAVASKVQDNMPGAMARPKVKEVAGCRAAMDGAASKKDKEGSVTHSCWYCESLLYRWLLVL